MLGPHFHIVTHIIREGGAPPVLERFEVLSGECTLGAEEEEKIRWTSGRSSFLRYGHEELSRPGYIWKVGPTSAP